MAEEKPAEEKKTEDALVSGEAKEAREKQLSENKGTISKPRKKKRRGKQLEIPEHTRLTFLFFPPYGIAWLLTHKELDKEARTFGAIGMTIYLFLWAIPFGLLAYAHTLSNS